MLQLQKILVATDFSEGSESAHKLASAIARRWGSVVDIINVVPTVAYLGESVLSLGLPLDMEKDIYPKLIEKARFDAEKEFTNHYSEENKGKVIAVTGRKASEEIVNRATKGYDLVILGTKGEHSHFLAGGTSEMVVRHCNSAAGVKYYATPINSNGMGLHIGLIESGGLEGWGAYNGLKTYIPIGLNFKSNKNIWISADAGPQIWHAENNDLVINFTVRVGKVRFK